HELPVGASWRGAEIDDARAREPPLYLLPAFGGVVVGLVHKDQVEKISLQIVKPAVLLAGYLLNVGNVDVAVNNIVEIHAPSCDDRGLWKIIMPRNDGAA